MYSALHYANKNWPLWEWYQLVVTTVLRISALGHVLCLYLINSSSFLSYTSHFWWWYCNINKTPLSLTRCPFLSPEKLSGFEICSDVQHIHTLMIKVAKINCRLHPSQGESLAGCDLPLKLLCVPGVREQGGQGFEIKCFSFSSTISDNFSWRMLHGRETVIKA